MSDNSGQIVHRLVDLGSQKLAAITANEQAGGVPVVFVHGITACVDFWRPSLPDEVRNQRHWISLSLPGHAPSEFDAARFDDWQHVTPARWAEWYDSALQQLVGDQPVQVVGWSTGGFTALTLAAHFPQRVHSVLSISGFAVGRWLGLIGTMQQLSMSSLSRLIVRWNFGAVGRHRSLFDLVVRSGVADRESFRASDVRPETMDAWFTRFAQHSPTMMAELFRKLAQLDVSAELTQIACPTLIAGGDADPYIPVSHTHWLADQVPGAEKVIWPGTGHMFFAERTREYQELLVRWLERTA